MTSGFGFCSVLYVVGFGSVWVLARFGSWETRVLVRFVLAGFGLFFPISSLYLDLDLQLDDGGGDVELGVVGGQRAQFPRLERHVDVRVLDQSQRAELLRPERYQPISCRQPHTAIFSFTVLIILVGKQEGHPARKKNWMSVCLTATLHVL